MLGRYLHCHKYIATCTCTFDEPVGGAVGSDGFHEVDVFS